MSERNLKQIGEEALSYRDESKLWHDNAKRNKDIADAILKDLFAIGDVADKHLPKTEDERKQHRKDYREKEAKVAQDLGYAVYDAESSRRMAISTDAGAKDHYEQNRSEYHRMAFMEATLDGKEINVDHVHPEAEAVDVKVLPPK